MALFISQTLVKESEYILFKKQNIFWNNAGLEPFDWQEFSCIQQVNLVISMPFPARSFSRDLQCHFLPLLDANKSISNVCSNKGTYRSEVLKNVLIIDLFASVKRRKLKVQSCLYRASVYKSSNVWNVAEFRKCNLENSAKRE